MSAAPEGKSKSQQYHYENDCHVPETPQHNHPIDGTCLRALESLRCERPRCYLSRTCATLLLFEAVILFRDSPHFDVKSFVLLQELLKIIIFPVLEVFHPGFVRSPQCFNFVNFQCLG